MPHCMCCLCRSFVLPACRRAADLQSAHALDLKETGHLGLKWYQQKISQFFLYEINPCRAQKTPTGLNPADGQRCVSQTRLSQQRCCLILLPMWTRARSHSHPHIETQLFSLTGACKVLELCSAPSRSSLSCKTKS